MYQELKSCTTSSMKASVCKASHSNTPRLGPRLRLSTVLLEHVIHSPLMESSFNAQTVPQPALPTVWSVPLIHTSELSQHVRKYKQWWVRTSHRDGARTLPFSHFLVLNKNSQLWISFFYHCKGNIIPISHTSWKTMIQYKWKRDVAKPVTVAWKWQSKLIPLDYRCNNHIQILYINVFSVLKCTIFNYKCSFTKFLFWIKFPLYWLLELDSIWVFTSSCCKWHSPIPPNPQLYCLSHFTILI